MTSAVLEDLLEKLDVKRRDDAAICVTIGIPASILKEGPFWLQQRAADVARSRS